MKAILKMLAGGDLRSIGRVNEVVKTVLANPKLFPEAFSGLLENDFIVRMRSADALEKISSTKPELLQPFKVKLIREVSKGIWHR